MRAMKPAMLVSVCATGGRRWLPGLARTWAIGRGEVSDTRSEVETEMTKSLYSATFEQKFEPGNHATVSVTVVTATRHTAQHPVASPDGSDAHHENGHVYIHLQFSSSTSLT